MENLTDFTSLVYRGEGNNSIVLANPQTRKVYRFRKGPEGTSTFPQFKKTHTYVKELTHTSKFIKSVMQELLGKDITHDMRIMEVNASTLTLLNDHLKPLRPAYRCHKQIDTQYSQMIEAPDVTLLPLSSDEFTDGPTLSVEIKPKFGCIPQFDDAPSFKKEVCRFCMLQFHPCKVGLWKERSQYCPCDLFSGNRKRMRIALVGLLQCPQINLRIFKNGQPVFTCSVDQLHLNLLEFFYSEVDSSTTESTLKDLLVEMLIEALLLPLHPESPQHKASQPFSTANGKHHPQSHCSPFEWNSVHYHLSSNDDNPRSSCTLFPLTRLPIDSSSMKLLSVAANVPFKQVCALQSHSRAYTEAPCELPFDSALARILKVQNLAKCDILPLQKHYQNVSEFLAQRNTHWDWSMVSTFCEDETVDDDVLRSIQIVSDYLISLVAKDCSLMVAFRRAKSSSSASTSLPCLTFSGSTSKFVVRTSVIDLDPKPIKKLEDHFKLEGQVLSSFLEGSQSLLKY